MFLYASPGSKMIRQNFLRTNFSVIVDVLLKTIDRLRILSDCLLWAIYIQYFVYENKQSNNKPWHKICTTIER